MADRDDAQVLGVDGAVEDDGDNDSYGNMAERLLTGACDELLRVE